MTIVYILILLIAIVFVHDAFISKKHTILRNFPVIGWGRFLIEKLGPELRQYIIETNRSGSPFSRVFRSYIYASAKKQNNNNGFGSDADFKADGHFFIKHSAFPFVVDKNHLNKANPDFLPCAKTIGKYHNRKFKYHPNSIVNISAMSYGALGRKATEANNRGAAMAGAYHNTGEGGFSPYHNKGADVVFQIGTAYYGCRDKEGKFDMNLLVSLCKEHRNIRMIEIKLSQGAKPGKGGILPAEKVTPEIAKVRGIKPYTPSVSPGNHTAFTNTEELVLFIEKVAKETGLPVGIKSAIGHTDFWWDLVYYMKKHNGGPDFITIDGSEGGTGAAPAAFADNISLPLDLAFTNVYKIFASEEMADNIVFIASGKLGFPSAAVKAFAMGADMINLAREILMSVGCIQAQRCHTGNCPAGITTHKWWLQRGFDIDDKKERAYNYITTLRKDILDITHACGYEHPTQFKPFDVVVNVQGQSKPVSLEELYEIKKSTIYFNGTNNLYETMKKVESENIQQGWTEGYYKF